MNFRHATQHLVLTIGAMYYMTSCAPSPQPYVQGERVSIFNAPGQCNVLLQRTRTSLATAEYSRAVIVQRAHSEQTYRLPPDAGGAGAMSVVLVDGSRAGRFIVLHDNESEYWIGMDATGAYRISREGTQPIAIKYNNGFPQFSVALTDTDFETAEAYFTQRGIVTVESLVGSYTYRTIGRVGGRTGELRFVPTEGGTEQKKVQERMIGEKGDGGSF